MRIFKDLGMVEYLGSGIPRILKAYSRDAYIFSSRFIRTAFPMHQDGIRPGKPKDHRSFREDVGENVGENFTPAKPQPRNNYRRTCPSNRRINTLYREKYH